MDQATPPHRLPRPSQLGNPVLAIKTCCFFFLVFYLLLLLFWREQVWRPAAQICLQERACCDREAGWPSWPSAAVHPFRTCCCVHAEAQLFPGSSRPGAACPSLPTLGRPTPLQAACTCNSCRAWPRRSQGCAAVRAAPAHSGLRVRPAVRPDGSSCLRSLFPVSVKRIIHLEHS